MTKYDPALRDARGAYRRDEWTSFGDIGSSVGGDLLTAEKYRRVEDAYVAAALAFWSEAGRPTLIVQGLENPGGRLVPPEGSAVEEALLGDVIRSVLREEFWCRLEGEGCFLHFGCDYYMYLGTSDSCRESCSLAAASGLFVEELVSPHHRETGF